METILVTGGAGFVGSSISEALVSRGFRVVVIDDLSSGRLENIDHLLHNRNFAFVRGSVLDRGLIRSVMKTYQVSAVSHQAAIPGVMKSILDPVRSVDANITGTANIFDSAVKGCCRRVVFASSHAVYGEGAEARKQEQTEQKPRSLYAITKAAQEMIALNFCEVHSLEIIGLRYFMVYGRRQSPAAGRSIVPAFITAALDRTPLQIEGDGLQVSDFVNIDDVVQANLLALSMKNVSGRCFNIGSGTGLTMMALATAILKITKSTSAIVHTPARTAALANTVADIETARSCLGYIPAVGIEQGLTETIAWYRKRSGAMKQVPSAASDSRAPSI